MPKKTSRTARADAEERLSQALKTPILDRKKIQQRDWQVAAYHELSHAAVAAVLGASCVEVYLGVKDEPLNPETKSVAGSCRHLGLTPADAATMAWAGIIGEFLLDENNSGMDDFDLYTEFLDNRSSNPPSPTDQAVIDRLPKKKRESTCDAAWKLARTHWKDIETMARKCQKAFSSDDGFYGFVEFDGKRITLRSKY